MTEVPDHLLQRSRERRAALGGGGGDAPTPPAGAASGAGVEPQEAPGRAVAATEAAPAVVEEAAPPPPPPPYVQAALDRKKLPAYMGPVGIAALLWVFIYAGVLFSPGATITDPVLEHGQEVYASQCAGCHGGAGQGGTGRKIAGEVFLTFPNIADHIAWVVNGSPPAGTPYGDPNRPGGQRISQDGFGAMPAFGGFLSEEDILAVVRYEREVLDSAPAEQSAAGEGGVDAENTETDETGADPANQAESQGGDVGDASSSEDAGSGNEGADEVETSEGTSGDTADDDPDTGGGASPSSGGEPDEG